MVYLDTSALLAVLDAADEYHLLAKEVWTALLTSGATLVASNYVLVETYALLQRRLGMEAVQVFHADIVPLLKVEWVSEAVHLCGAHALVTANRRSLSLVDCVSFEVMRRLGIKEVFTFDQDFAEQGFHCLTRAPLTGPSAGGFCVQEG
ncbi:MAG: PIN domain-containing protein [Bacillota bacterium]|nr:PIN domain-containing protein [Bacillota bacterium]